MSKPIPLTNRPGLSALVSDEDYDELSRFKWRFHNGYAARTIHADGVTRLEYMHRVVLSRMYSDLPLIWQADHINPSEKLNNTRENLRIAVPSENQWNKGVPSNSGTGFKGVGRYRNKYHARIKVNGQKIHLGYWDALETAVLVRDAAARRFHGQFAYLNFPGRCNSPEIEALLDQVLSGKAAAPLSRVPVVRAKSSYRGVYGERGRWRAKIRVNGRDIHLGYFTSEMEAAQAYDRYVTEHNLPRRLNFPDLRQAA